MLIATAVTASILSFLYVKLSLNVIRYRQKYDVSIGDGDHEDLFRAIRAHANLTEYAPIALILLACLEINRAPLWIVSILAAMFIIGRLLHPVGMKSSKSPWQARVWGIQLTLLSLIAIGVANIVVVGMLVFAH